MSAPGTDMSATCRRREREGGRCGADDPRRGVSHPTPPNTPSRHHGSHPRRGPRYLRRGVDLSRRGAGHPRRGVGHPTPPVIICAAAQVVYAAAWVAHALARVPHAAAWERPVPARSTAARAGGAAVGFAFGRRPPATVARVKKRAGGVRRLSSAGRFGSNHDACCFEPRTRCLGGIATGVPTWMHPDLPGEAGPPRPLKVCQRLCQPPVPCPLTGRTRIGLHRTTGISSALGWAASWYTVMCATRASFADSSATTPPPL